MHNKLIFKKQHVQVYLNILLIQILIQRQVMDYWGKITNTINNVTGVNNMAEMATELKKRQKIIKQYDVENKKLKQDAQFINKAYQQLQIQKKGLEKLNNNAFSFLTQSCSQTLKNYEQKIIKSVIEQVLKLCNEELGEDFLDINFTLNLNGEQIYFKHIEKLFYEIRQQTIKQIQNDENMLNQIKRKNQVIQANIIKNQQSQTRHRDQLNIIKNQMENSIKSLQQEKKGLQQERNSLKISISEMESEHKKQLEETTKKIKQLNQMTALLKVQLQKKQKQLYQQCETNKYTVQQLQSSKKSNQDLKNQIISKNQVVTKYQLKVENIQMKIYTVLQTFDSIKVKLKQSKAQSDQIKSQIKQYQQEINLYLNNSKQILFEKLNSFNSLSIEVKDQSVQTQSLLQCKTQFQEKQIQAIVESFQNYAQVKANNQEIHTQIQNNVDEKQIQTYKPQYLLNQTQTIYEINQKEIQTLSDKEQKQSQVIDQKIQINANIASQEKIDEQNRITLRQSQQVQQKLIQQSQLLESLKLNNIELLKKIQEMNSNLQLSTIKIAELNQMINTYETNKIQLSQQIILKNQQISKNSILITESLNNKKQIQDKCVQIQKQSANCRELLNASEVQLKNCQRTIQQLLSDNIKKDQQNIALNQQLAANKQSLNQISAKLADSFENLKLKQELFASKCQELDNKIHVLNINHLQKQQQIKQLKNITNEKNLTLADLQNQIKQVSSQLTRQREQRKQAQQDLDIMKSVNQDFQQKYRNVFEKQQQMSQFKKLSDEFHSSFKVQITVQAIKQIAEKDIKNQQKINKYDLQITNLRKQNQNIIQQLEKSLQTNKRLQETISLTQRLNKQLNTDIQKLTQCVRKQTLDQQQAKDKIINLKNQLNSQQIQYKQQIQQFKIKLDKKEQQMSKFADKLRQSETKASNLKFQFDQYAKASTLSANQQKFKWQSEMGQINLKFTLMKQQLYNEMHLKDQQLGKYQNQLQKNLIETAKEIQKIKKQANQRSIQLQQVFKAEKNGFEKIKKQEISKLNDQIQSFKKENLQKRNEIEKMKQLLLQQRQNSAKLAAQIQNNNYTIGKYEQLESYANQLNQKLLFKDEEMKKVYINMQLMKSTIAQLQDGIQTYQSYAEDKSREIDQIRESELKNIEKIQSISRENEFLKKKIQQTKTKNKYIEQNSPIKLQSSIMDKMTSDHLEPIKNIFLKYFQTGSSYEQKIQSLNLLCEILKLNKKEQQMIQLYKKTKLFSQSNQKEQKNTQTIQNKFFSFLTAQ